MTSFLSDLFGFKRRRLAREEKLRQEALRRSVVSSKVVSERALREHTATENDTVTFHNPTNWDGFFTPASPLYLGGQEVPACHSTHHTPSDSGSVSTGSCDTGSTTSDCGGSTSGCD
jgi:hypothetical protein